MYPEKLVSVIIPCYNCSLFVEDAVRSIMNQSYHNLEIILINDGSSDNTPLILSVLSEEDIRIKYLDNDKNVGLIETLNKGLKICKGEYIARMDADDIALPNRILEQVLFMEKHNSVVVCSAGAYNIDSEGGRKKRYYPISDDGIRAELLFNSPIVHPCALIRASTIKENKLQFHNEYKYAEDYKFWIDLLRHGKGANLPKFLLIYRVLATSQTAIGETNNDNRMLVISKIQNECLSLNGINSSSEYLHYCLSQTDRIKSLDLNECSLKVIIKYFDDLCSNLNKINKTVLRSNLGIKIIKLVYVKKHELKTKDYFYLFLNCYIYFGLFGLVFNRLRYILNFR